MNISKWLLSIDRWYATIPQNNVWQRSYRYGVRCFSNLLVFIRGNRVKQQQGIVDNNTIIVSLTSYPARIKNVWMTCATLLNQEKENIRVMLWLSKEQFPREMADLPRKLKGLTKKGLDIRFVDDDLRPHKKYFYALKEFPNNDVVTVDDDVLYSPKLVSALMEGRRRHYNCVICNRGITLKRDSYKNWIPNNIYDVERTDILPTGIGGVLYPAHIFDGTPIHDAEAIKQTCLNGDDLWLNLMTRLKGHKVVQTGFKTGLVTILSSQNSALCTENVSGDRNDKQIALLSQWTNRKLGCDFYVNS